MDLYEYQAKELFAKHGVPTQSGEVITDAGAAAAAADRIGGPVVVKAQVKTGGRGKAGGVKVAKNPDEAFEAAQVRENSAEAVTKATTPLRLVRA